MKPPELTRHRSRINNRCGTTPSGKLNEATMARGAGCRQRLRLLGLTLGSLAVIATFVGFPSCSFAAETDEVDATAKTPPNILMIAIDDLNDWVEPLGGHPLVKTPHLSRLASRGVTFTNAHCQAPLCNPSRTSLLTGRRPHSTGIYGLAPWFRKVETLAAIETLPQYFMRQGYQTVIGGKIYHGAYGRNDPQEANVWGPNAGVGVTPKTKLIPPTPMGNHPLMDWGVFPHQDNEKGDWLVASWAEQQLDGPLKASKKPFFLACGFFLPHVPCFATQKWFDLYPETDETLPPILDTDRDDTPFAAWMIHWKLPEPRTKWMRENNQLQNLARSYLACTSFVDSQVGRVLDALDRSGKADNTIVVLWSDHGYHLGEKGITGKNSLWERSTRVPLIFAGPGIAAGEKCEWPAELLDIYPTLVDAVGLDKTASNEGSASVSRLDGHSLRPQLLAPETPHDRPAITTHNADNHSIRSRSHRLIEYADGSREFYDLSIDPNEHVNRIDDPKYAMLIAAHARWIPKTSLPPAPGSAHRILVREGDQFFWEGNLVNPNNIPE